MTITSPQMTFVEQMQGGIRENLSHEMVGDVQRMKLYPERGFQIVQEVPTDVWNAFEELVAKGYDKHLLK